MPMDREREESGLGEVSTEVNGSCMEEIQFQTNPVSNLASDFVIPKYLAKVISHFLYVIGVIFH